MSILWIDRGFDLVPEVVDDFRDDPYGEEMLRQDRTKILRESALKGDEEALDILLKEAK